MVKMSVGGKRMTAATATKLHGPTVTAAIAAHRKAQAAVIEAVFHGPAGQSTEVLFSAERAALEAVAKARCEVEKSIRVKLRYLVDLSRRDDDDDGERLRAIRTAVETWLESENA